MSNIPAQGPRRGATVRSLDRSCKRLQFQHRALQDDRRIGISAAPTKPAIRVAREAMIHAIRRDGLRAEAEGD